MSTYIIIDEIKEKLLLAGEGIFSCCRCTRFILKTYYLSEIKKIRIYLSSIPDPKIGFHKFYFINCDVYSLNNELESLFSNIEYSKEKFDEFVSFFQGHLNPEVITIEIDMSDVNKNNTSYPPLTEQNQIPKLSTDESV